jgi:hypothetical protein
MGQPRRRFLQEADSRAGSSTSDLDSDVRGGHHHPCPPTLTSCWRTMPSLLHFLSSFFVFLSLSVAVRASALTTTIAPNERICFFADVDKVGEKIGVIIRLFGLGVYGLTFLLAFGV